MRVALAGGPQRSPRGLLGVHGGGCGAGAGHLGPTANAPTRSPVRAAVLLGDLAGVVAQVTAGGRGVAAALPPRLSTHDFAPALEQFLGSGVSLSPATINRLTTQWQ